MVFKKRYYGGKNIHWLGYIDRDKKGWFLCFENIKGVDCYVIDISLVTRDVYIHTHIHTYVFSLMDTAMFE